jgi:hypothetical protein
MQALCFLRGLFFTQFPVSVAGIICPAGTFVHHSGTSCSPCWIGTYSGGSSWRACMSCPDGKYQNNAGRSSCFDCPRCAAGSYILGCGLDRPGTCTACPRGTYSMAGAESCIACPSCPAGSATTCGVGTIGNCVACASGTYTSVSMSAAQCIACESGTFQVSTGASACNTCAHYPAGNFTMCGGNIIGVCRACLSGT